MTTQLVIKILIGLVGYTVWALFAWDDPALRPDFLNFNIAMVMGTIGLVLRDMPTRPPGDKQSGFASTGLLLALAAGITLLLAGCTSVQYAGNASYSVKPFVTDAKTGATVCCEVEIKDGKERATLDLRVVKNGDGYDITLSERGVLAFQGQAIAAGAMKDAIEAAAKAAAAAVLAPILPALVPAAGAALASPGVGAAAVGAAGVIGVQKVSP
jgi:hypothetical protein